MQENFDKILNESSNVVFICKVYFRVVLVESISEVVGVLGNVG